MKNNVHIRVIGKDVNYFLRLLIRKEILLISVDINDKGLDLIVSEEDYLKIKKIKTSYQVMVINIIGKKKILSLLDRYKLILICMMIGIFIVELLSNIIFEIEIIHHKEEIRDIIAQNLNDLGIRRFRLKVSYSKKEEIIETILKRETDKIEWLEIESRGTKYIIHIEERKKNPEQEERPLQHIIATKDAMILSINAEVGEVAVKQYDYIKKGDILISGLIHNKDEIKEKVSAQGQVYGEVWYQVIVELPINYNEEILLDKTSRCLSFRFFNRNQCIFPIVRFTHYKESNVNILENRLLPLGINLSTRQEKKVTSETLNQKTGEKKALQYAEEKLKEQLNDTDSIISKKTLKITIKDSKIVVEVFFKVKENITGFLNIDHIDIEEENQRMEVE